MNYKEEDKKYIEKSGRYCYYEFTKKEIKRVISRDINEVEANDFKMLIQMIYPTNMIASGLFQPILIFRIGINGKRIDPPIEAYDSIKQLLSKIISHVKSHSDLQFHESWEKIETQ